MCVYVYALVPISVFVLQMSYVFLNCTNFVSSPFYWVLLAAFFESRALNKRLQHFTLIIPLRAVSKRFTGYTSLRFLDLEN